MLSAAKIHVGCMSMRCSRKRDNKNSTREMGGKPINSNITKQLRLADLPMSVNDTRGNRV